MTLEKALASINKGHAERALGHVRCASVSHRGFLNALAVSEAA